MNKNRYYAKDIAKILKIHPRHVWQRIRLVGIEPLKHKPNNQMSIDRKQLNRVVELFKQGKLKTTAEKRKVGKKKRVGPPPVLALCSNIKSRKIFQYVQPTYEVPERWEWLDNNK